MVPGALEDTTALSELVDGADAAFLLWPGFEGDPRAPVAALAAGVDHVVYLSGAALTGTEPGGVLEGVWADVERAVADTDLSWTFVRVGGFAANTLAWAEQIRSGDTVRIPYPDAGRSLIDERDIAAVVVQALLDPALRDRAVTITGPETVTDGVAEVTGHPARSFDEWARANRHHFASLSTSQWPRRTPMR